MSMFMLLSSTSTIAIDYSYYTARPQMLILPSNEDWKAELN